MLKIIIPLWKTIFKCLEVGDSEVDRFGNNSNEEFIRKSRKSNGQKLFKSQKTTKSGKNESKSGNLPKFDIM